VRSRSLQGPYPGFDEWRENSLRRLEAERPDLAVVSSAGYYHVDDDGERLGHVPSRPLLMAAYRDTLERLQATGAEVALMIDIAQAPFNVSECVSEHLDSLSECAFEIDDSLNKVRFDVPTGKSVPGISAIDIRNVICPDGICRAVIGNVLVYRETNHITETFSRTLKSYIEKRLPTVP